MADTTISPKVWTVYRITNTVNGKIYIGVTCYSLNFRWKAHVNAAFNVPTRLKIDTFLWMAIRKYGPDAFEALVLATFLNRDTAMQGEKDFIAKFNSQPPHGYNMTIGGVGHSVTTQRTTWTHSADSRLKRAQESGDANHLPGATWVPRHRKWRANIRINGKKVFLGLFDTAEEASTMYLEVLDAYRNGNFQPPPRVDRRGSRHSLDARLRMASVQNAHEWPGAYWIPNRQKWSAMIRINGKQKRLGYFHTAREASAAYLRALDAHFNQATPGHQFDLLAMEQPSENEVIQPSASGLDLRLQVPTHASSDFVSRQLTFVFDNFAPNLSLVLDHPQPSPSSA